MGQPNSRTEVYRIPVDAVAADGIIQLPEGTGPFHKITVSIESALNAWTLYAPFTSSPSKAFSVGAEYVFEHGPYNGLDVLGYVKLDSGSGYVILFCER